MQTVSLEHIDQLVRGTHWDPRAILGPHPAAGSSEETTIRCFLPEARDVAIVLGGSDRPAIGMARIHDAGLFEALLPGPLSATPYRLRLTDHAGQVSERHDPYAFPPLLTDFELHLFAEGTFFKAYETMGSHLRAVQNIAGAHFVVWAPNATRVSVVGDFNQWDGRRHQMTNRGATGIWELFIPGLGADTLYKYELKSRQAETPLLKADPYAMASELRPKTASIVHDL